MKPDLIVKFRKSDNNNFVALCFDSLNYASREGPESSYNNPEFVIFSNPGVTRDNFKKDVKDYLTRDGYKVKWR